MTQLLVECSDPGFVVSLDEEFENVLRHIDFERARGILDQLGGLARELGPEFEGALAGFRVEMPNDGGNPPCFGSREATDQERLTQLLAQAKEREIGGLQLRHTCLLPQHGPAPETREQYVRDLADGIRWARVEESLTQQRPLSLPQSMADHRAQLMDDLASSVLRGRAAQPGVGRRWVQDCMDRLKNALEDVSTRAEAVMTYELDRLDPSDVEAGERVCWAALAARLGQAVEKWIASVEEPLTFIYQRAALACMLWTECRGVGPARPLLEKRLQSCIEESEGVYTADGHEALKLLYDDLREPPWRSIGGVADQEGAVPKDDEGLDD